MSNEDKDAQVVMQIIKLLEEFDEDDRRRIIRTAQVFYYAED